MNCLLHGALLISFFVSTLGEDCEHETVCSELFGRCYTYVSKRATFEDAHNDCVLLGGNLLSINSHAENEQVKKLASSLFSTSNAVDFWIGAKSLEKEWSWIDDAEWTFTNWFAGEPRRQFAAMLMSTGYWRTSSETDRKPYVCSLSKKPTVSPVQNTCLPCPECRTINQCDSGWTYMEATESCYLILHNKTYSEAEGNCTDLGAHLASIHSEAENQMIAELSATGISVEHYAGQVWIGLVRSDNKYLWTDNTEANFFDWAVGEPNAPPGIACTMLMSDHQLPPPHSPYYRKWNDDLCSKQMRAAICQKPRK